MIEQLCDAIVARLQERMPEFSVEHFPDAPDRWLFGGTETLLVGYEGSQYGQVESLDPMSATRTVNVSVTLVVRALRGQLGAIGALESVRRALFGWRPAQKDPVTQDAIPLGFSRMVPTREGFVSEDHGIWRFVIEFSTTTTAVAETEALSGPPLAGVTLKDA